MKFISRLQKSMNEPIGLDKNPLAWCVITAVLLLGLLSFIYHINAMTYERKVHQYEAIYGELSSSTNGPPLEPPRLTRQRLRESHAEIRRLKDDLNATQKEQ